MPSIGATATSGGPGISHWDIPPMFAATRVACFVSLPRRYSTCTVSSGSSLRASSTSFLPGPDSSSSSGFTAASEVPLNFVMMSPTLRPALSAGPPGALGPHVRGTRPADVQELLHEIHPLLPQVDEVSGVSLGLRGAQLCQLAVDDGNAVFQGGRERRGAAARHPSVGIVTPQLLLQRRRLLLHAGELGGVDRLRPERP